MVFEEWMREMKWVSVRFEKDGENGVMDGVKVGVK